MTSKTIAVDNKKFNCNLQKYRSWKIITQQQLADKLGISVSILRSIEIGKKYPNDNLLQKICTYFNISQTQLFDI